jgi:anti-sigma factor ChrR (cupin superfamily)
MHKHPKIEQTYVVEGSFYDRDGICRAGEFVWRRVGSFHKTHSDEGAVILAVYRKPNVSSTAPDTPARVLSSATSQP